METKRTLYGRLWQLVCTIALILSVVMAFETPVQAVANSLPKYISEMILVVGDSVKAAKSSAEAKGYTLMEDPIYEGDDSNTYIAYKITTNPNKAIKKIKTMNMTGDWSFSEYKDYMENQKKQVTIIMNGLKDAIAEYAEIYFNKPNEKGEKRWEDKNKAHYAKTVLDYLRDDDTDMTIGDLFLLPVMTDKDAKSANKKKGEYLSETHLLEILMQSNTNMLYIIEQALMMACSSYNSKSFLETIGSKSFTAQSYYDKTEYKSAAQDVLITLADTQKQLLKYTESPFAYSEDMLDMIDAQNDDIVALVEEAIEEGNEYNIDEITKEVREEYANADISEYMEAYEVSEEEAKKALLSDDEYVAYRLLVLETERDIAFATDTDAARTMKQDYGNGLALYNILRNCNYRGYKNNDGKYEYNNLYELFTKKDLTKLQPDDDGNYDYSPYELTDFYPVVGAMSKGERGLLKIGFSQVITSHLLSQEMLFESLKVIQKDLEDAIREFTEADLLEQKQKEIENGTAADVEIEETEVKTISIYANVDRSLSDPDSDIAMTGVAVREFDQHGKTNFRDGSLKGKLDAIQNYLVCAAGGLAAAEIILVFSLALAIFVHLESYSVSTVFLGLEFSATVISEATVFFDVYAGSVLIATAGRGCAGFGSAFKILFSAASGIGKAMISMVVVTIGILIITFAVFLLMKHFSSEQVNEYLCIPRVLCSYEELNEKTDEGDYAKDYVYYYGVKNPDIDPASKDPDGNVKKYQIQDIYNWELDNTDREWVAVYTTTDNGVGAPILAGSLKVSEKCILSEKSPDGKYYQPVATFGEGESEYAYDLLTVTGGGERYLHYLVDEEGFARFGLTPKRTGFGVASVFAENGGLIAGCAISLIAGIGGGIGISALARKRRKKKNDNA